MEAQGSYEVQHASLFPPIGVTGQGQYFAPSETAGFSFAPGLGRGTSMLRYYGANIGFSSTRSISSGVYAICHDSRLRKSLAHG